jgi:hypothetical protein
LTMMASAEAIYTNRRNRLRGVHATLLVMSCPLAIQDGPWTVWHHTLSCTHGQYIYL